MPRREIGLMGYVGEAVVSHWLAVRYPEAEAEIVSQIRPLDVPAKGGPYLDLAVVQNGVVESIFEVKSQDYIWGKDSEVNISLDFIWERRHEAIGFTLQDGRTFNGTPETQAYLVLLAPPNLDGIKAIGAENLQNVLLFDDLWRTTDAASITADKIVGELREDVVKVLEILRQPTQGVRLRKAFLDARGSVPRIVRRQ